MSSGRGAGDLRPAPRLATDDDLRAITRRNLDDAQRDFIGKQHLLL